MACAALAAQPVEISARHLHLHGGARGTLRIGAESIRFEEAGGKHSREWPYQDIQQLSLGENSLHILTYEDRKWQLGRDRDYRFDHLPPGSARKAYAMLRDRLDRRLVAELPESGFEPLWQSAVKLRRGLGGTEGTLRIGADRIVFEAKDTRQSRTWLFRDIENVSNSGLFEFTVTTRERSDWRHASPSEFRFQLKQELPETRYNDLWRRLEHR